LFHVPRFSQFLVDPPISHLKTIGLLEHAPHANARS